MGAKLATRRSAILTASCVAAMTQPSAAQTVAGMSIRNVATLRGDTANQVSSNAVTLVVAERLDCTLTADGASGSPSAIGVVLTNGGNGQEVFAVAATGADGKPLAIATDESRDGRFDPAHRLSDGLTPVLASGATLRLLVAIDQGAASMATVSARATTGTGLPGTLLAGRGDGDGDAVVGASGGAARLTIALAAAAPPTIDQTQAVLAADGGTTPRRGAVVTYTLVARFTAASSAASIVDPIPANAAYRPGSLSLDGAAIPADDRLVDGQVVVPLGAVEAGAVHRLVFQVVIQ